MSTGMLPGFHVRNLRSSSLPTEKHDSLVRITAPAYDSTISDNPAATLKYRDEDGDNITLGSSRELIDKLEEPISQPSAISPRRKKDRMSIAMVLSEVQQNPDAVNHHTFDIEEREEIQRLWQEIQQRNKPPPPPSTSPVVEQPPSGHLARAEQPSKLLNDDPSLRKIGNDPNGHSASRRRLRTQAIVEGNIQDNERKKNKLAVAYDKFKVDIWTPIAAELGISWGEAEALHWVLGRDEMVRRAEKLNPLQTDSFEDPVSVKSTDEDWHEDRNKEIQPPADRSAVQKFEDYRRHHFNATIPPQLRNAVAASLVAPKFAIGKAPYAGVAKSTLARGNSPSLVAAPVANLTTEGRRQAQAAGDILRSRTTPSRHRKAVTNTTDHTNHQNRWASYKSPNTAFSPKTSAAPSQGFGVPTLTPEGRRQAQAAGDKLRSRTNPIRHSRPSRSGSLEHGVSKNRWASYVAPRVARFEERHHIPADPKETSQTMNSSTAEQEKQPSLLEVFEAELAKSFPNSDDVTGEEQAPEPEVVDIPSPTQESSSPSPDTNQASTPIPVASPPQQPRPAFHGLDLLNDYIQGLTSGDGEFPQEISNAVDQAVRVATGAVGALVRGIPGRPYDDLDQPEPLAAERRVADIKGIDDALNGLRDFVNNITTGLDGSSDSTPSDSPGMSMKDTSAKTTTTASDPMRIEDFSKNATEALNNVCSALFQTRPSPREEQDPPFADVVTKVEANPSNGRQAPCPRFVSEIRRTQQIQSENGPWIQREGTMNGPRYHKPGPIHLPDATPSRPDVGPPSDGFSNSDLPNQSWSTESVDKPATSPPPAATRFPTLAQFEGQVFAPAQSFPALPSMEPLVPQRIASQNIVDMLDTQTRERSDAKVLLPETSQQLDSQTISAEQQHMIEDGISPARLTDNQLSSFALQSPAAQATSTLVYAQDMAKDQRQQKRSEDSVINLMLNEGQDRKPLPKTRQEPTSNDVASADMQSGDNPTMHILNTPQYSTLKTHALQDYHMQLALLEQQSKKRWLMAQEECEKYREDKNKTQSPAKQQLEVEERNEQHTALAREQGVSYDGPQLPGRFPHTEELKDQCTNAVAAETFRQSEVHDDLDPFNFPTSSSAARLAEPFDPLDVQPSAQPQLIEGIRRNATVAGTGSRHNTRRRRPYSEAFDGFGRVAWESFEGATEHEDRNLSDINSTRRREQARKGRDRHMRRQEQLRRSATLHESRLTSPFRRYDDEHHDDSTVFKIDCCVSQLRDLGFGSEEDGLGNRLLVYAQAAEGELVEAIDMIDEEQRAYMRL